MNEFEDAIAGFTGGGLYALGIDTLQMNLGLICNQSCAHCHVSAGPGRSETMGWGTMEKAMEAASAIRPKVVDLTGGAPELNPDFRRLVAALKSAGHTVQTRTNLTALTLPGMEDLPYFFRDNNVRLVASLPCYLEENVNAQRGAGAYEKSIEAMRRLNAAGYGMLPELALELVYNPGGAFLPPDQKTLESTYRRELAARFGVSFTRLITITNMPLGRFQSVIARTDRAEEYRRLLCESFNPSTLEGLMCRRQISVGWDGGLYDCDFNLALGLKVAPGSSSTVGEFDLERLARRRIVTGPHCFGCTAGSGSSCRGALV